MSVESERFEERQSLAILAGEILRDSQKLFEQQLALTKLQFLQEVARAKPFAFLLLGGLIALLAGGVLSAFALVYLLIDLTEQPLWACFAMTALACLLITAISLFIARIKWKNRDVLNG